MPKGKSLVLLKRTGSIKEIASLKAHTKYVGFRSQERGGNKGFFGRESNHVNYKDFIQRVTSNKALQFNGCVKAHKLFFSLRQKDYEAYKRSGKDFKDLVRATLKAYEEKNNVKLDWIANIHDKEGNPHCHIIIKGVSDIAGDRGLTRIKFDYLTDFNGMKIDFEREFMKDVEYKLFEREDIKEITKDISKGFEAVLQSIAIEAGKENSEQDRGESKGAFSKFRSKIKNAEKITKEKEVKEKGNESLDR